MGDTKNVATSSYEGLGGNGANVAAALGRLGCNTRFVSVLINDINGKVLQKYFEREDVSIGDSEFYPPGQGKTGTSFIIIDKDMGRTIIHSRQEPLKLNVDMDRIFDNRRRPDAVALDGRYQE